MGRVLGVVKPLCRGGSAKLLSDLVLWCIAIDVSQIEREKETNREKAMQQCFNKKKKKINLIKLFSI
jgi:hypothetical protein